MSYVLGLQDTFIFFFKRMRLKFHFLLGYVWLEVKYGGWKIKERKWVCVLFGKEGREELFKWDLGIFY